MFEENFAFEELFLFERLKEREIASFSISSGERTGLKMCLFPFAKRYSEPLGFGNWRDRFYKKSVTGLVFEFRIDVGGVPRVVTRLPLEFYIYQASELRFQYVSTSFDLIIP
jgi:hypothetical protein